ncbi:hypothetical protein ART_0553 [Arthrobacter sp. PAMC 25486]|nr:hypothetical protein ART_0553 [Arthrobacter sp. PAMC 25486]
MLNQRHSMGEHWSRELPAFSRRKATCNLETMIERVGALASIHLIAWI